MKSPFTMSYLAGALYCLLSWCNPTSAEIRVEDFHGREVVLGSPARRIVALAPHIVENVFSAGAGDRLVGVVAYSDFPEQAKSIHRIGNFQSWSLEALAALRPDLVLLWGSGNGTDTLASLERLGFPVFVSELRKLTDISRSIRSIGLLAGTTQVSEQAALQLEQQLATLAEQYRSGRPVSVFYQIWNEPLQTVNGDHMISELIRLCGGRNIFDDSVLLAPKINVEAVLIRDPQAIVASGMDTSRPEWLDDWRQYASLTAVREEAMFFIPPDHIQRPTARVVLGAQGLCAQLQTLR